MVKEPRAFELTQMRVMDPARITLVTPDAPDCSSSPAFTNQVGKRSVITGSLSLGATSSQA